MGQHVTVMGCDKKESRKELKKHAATIHCSNALSLLQRKVSNALLYHAYKELMDKNEHEITIKQLCRLIGYQGNNHAVIREALKGLISTIIEWNVINDQTGTENWTASSILASVSLEGPLCYYAYSPRMKQLLHSPSMFGKIDLVIQSHFRSSYGLALYENCIRYRGLPYTKWFEMALFKKLMGVLPGKYDVFRDFKRRVLDTAIAEVNTYSDLILAAEFTREGRKVVSVRFCLKERAKKTRLGNKAMIPLVKSTKTSSIALQPGLMKDFGLSTEQVEHLIANYDAVFIQEKIALIKQSKPYLEGRIENLAGYLLSALKRNYQLPKVQTKLAANPINIEEAKLAMELAELNRQVEGLRADYQAYREQIIHAAIDSLSAEKKTVFMRQFRQFAEPMIRTILTVQKNKYSTTNVLASPPLKAQLRQFALRELDFIALASLEEFVVMQDEAKREAWQKLKSYDPDHPLLRFQE